MAKITLNDIRVDMETNESNHLRGLHLVIVDPVDGSIKSAKVFDTYASSELLTTWI